MIIPGQISAAQALLRWSDDQLAEHSGVSKPTITRLKAAEDVAAAGGHASNLEKLVTALESAGIIFIAENGGGAGVRLRRADPGSIAAEDLNASNDE